MKVIYHCYGGAHSSVVAAALHLNVLSADKVPSAGELMSLNLYDQTDKFDHGIFHRLGTDDDGHEVFSVGLRNQGKAITRTIKGFCALYGVADDEVVFVDTLDCVNWKMRVGGFLSRALKLVKLGRPLVIAGTKQAYQALVNKVEKVKKRLREHVTDSVLGGQDKNTAAQPEDGAQQKVHRPDEPGFPGGAPGPKTIYFCYGGTHTSVVCAAYHLGWLPAEREPTVREIIDLPLFDRVPQSELGHLVFFGTDDDGTQVFTVGMGSERPLAERAVRSFLEKVLFGTVPGDVLFRDCLQLAGLTVRLGGFLSRRLGLEQPGRRIVASSLRNRWRAFVEFVRQSRTTYNDAENPRRRVL